MIKDYTEAEDGSLVVEMWNGSFVDDVCKVCFSEDCLGLFVGNVCSSCGNIRSKKNILDEIAELYRNSL